MADPRQSRSGAPGAHPGRDSAPDRWEHVFRTAEVPLFIEDISRARASVARAAAAAAPRGLRWWLDAHPEFIGQVLAEVRVLDANDAAVRLNAAGSRDELLVSLDKLVLPESLSGFKDFICTLDGDAGLYEGEGRYRALDGGEYHTLNRAWIPAADDPDQTIVMATVDITALKGAEKALVESETRYRQLIETAKDVILRHDLAGRITFINRAGLELLGLSRDEAIGMPAERFTTADAFPAAARRREARESGEAGVFLYETEYRHRDGRGIPVEVSSTLLPAGAGGIGETQVLLIARDISRRRRLEAEQRRLEARLRDTHKLESLGVLAGGVAHDFNNLLVTIMGHAELLQDDLRDREQAANVREILAAGRQAADLCRQMQTFAGTAPATVGAGDMSAIVRDIGGLLAASVTGGSHLGYELADDLPPVRIDAGQIGQVLTNLVANASEAVAAEGGEIIVRTGCRDVTGGDPPGWRGGAELVPGRHVFCEVRDSGPGMEPEVVPLVCDPFFSTRSGGRGLGLSAALGVVRAHGGALVIDSGPGSGTSVSVWLPVAPTEDIRPAPAPAQAPAEVDLTGRTVLFVEDEASVRGVGESFLRRLGCRVLTAADGYDAVRLFGQRHDEIDAVLVDYTMPGLDGAATARRLHVIRPDLPLVITSGRDEAEVRARCGTGILAGFLAKPYGLVALREALGGVLRA